MSLESQLKVVLRRHDPPAGFAGRVMKRTNVETGFSLSRRGLKPAATLAAAAALASVLLGGWAVHTRNELLIAMRIASQKVAHAQQEIRK